MKKIVVGILAHVDAGKTTLSEGLLYASKSIMKKGRVDHKDSVLDYDVQERDRGITIFSKMANFNYNDCHMTLLDTPGHVDFSIEMERTLQVLDYAVVVISALDKVQSHTHTIFRLLKHYQIPTIVFMNKMDATHYTKEELFADLNDSVDAYFVDFTLPKEAMEEQLVLSDDGLLEYYAKHHLLRVEDVQEAIVARKIIPCVFGSALKDEGCTKLLDVLAIYARQEKQEEGFVAKAFKVSRDEQNVRLVHMKICSGTLQMKQTIGEDKVDQIRIYNGVKFKSVSTVGAGEICLVKGLHHIKSGDVIGKKGNFSLSLRSYLQYVLVVDEQVDIVAFYKQLQVLQDEDPHLKITLQNNHEISMQLMGEVQIEVLQRSIKERFSVDVSFQQGRILYKESISEVVEGVGHYEPLGHYAEIHLLLTPLNRQEGLQFENLCGENGLSRQIQSSVMNYLQCKQYNGVLSNSELCDVKISLLGGKTHLKHTQSIDIKEACDRALRNALLKCESILLEPYVEFSIHIDASLLSKVLFDLHSFDATYEIQQDNNEEVCVNGVATFERMRNYDHTLATMSHNKARFYMHVSGYDVCKQQEEVLKNLGYDAMQDVKQSGGSIFFKQGAGYFVAYDEVDKHMHVPYLYTPLTTSKEPSYNPIKITDEEIQRVMQRVHAEPKKPYKERVRKEVYPQGYKSKTKTVHKKCLLVDGYNMIFSFSTLQGLANEDLDAARHQLIQMLSSYQGYYKGLIIVVFDAYKQEHTQQSSTFNGSIHIVFTKKAQSADHYIEKASKEMREEYRVQVATSDYLQQIIVLSQGATRISASQLETLLLQSRKASENYTKTQSQVRNTPLEKIKEYEEN